ncbi:hypothetical protein TanjilG_17596 [Lupinus angustifolius]|uniref:Synergin gamma C-terminal domain-containing protein n=1 Tax=Lupinus angustifolius TaxID=3871 RepID=A0A1J7HK52_LUPAN|nr:PREDICTED: uncharacterized protein LOC109346191 [Lupinus angustifolius]OIW13036.1 hypothetical protein TanjilG_17596 [Lupinus angustifolius]
MAEDDGDDSFGDFMFASFPNQPFPSTTAVDDNGCGSDLFGVSHQNDNNTIAVHVQSPQKPAFNRPNGAIPLSIFGEEEEEEEHAFSNANNNTNSVKKGSDSNGSVGGITEVFSNFYNQHSQNESVSISDIAAPSSNADGNANANNFNSDSVDENDDEDGWEFKSAEWESGTKSQSIKAEDNGALGVGAMLDSSLGVSEMAGGGHLEFEFYPSSAVQNHVSPQLHLKNESNETINEFTVFSQRFGELNANSGSEPKQNLEDPKMAHIYTSSVEELKFDGGDPHGTIDPSHALESNQSYFNSSSLGQDSHISESYFKTNIYQDNINQNNPSPTTTNVHCDVNLFESKGALAEIGTTHENSQIGAENCRAALPLSIFGDEMPDTDEQSVSRNISPFAPTSPLKNSTNSPGSNLPINDIWNLYSQAENRTSPNMTPKANENGFDASARVSGANLDTGIDDFNDGFGDFMDASAGTGFAHESALNSSFNHEPQVNENGLHSSSTVLNSDLTNGANGFEDGSWEFKEAFSETSSQDQASAINHRGLPTQLSTKLETLDYVDFYSKMKDELCNAVLFHLHNLKTVQSVAAISGNNAKAKMLQEEIKELSKILHQDNIIPKENLSENYSLRNVYFNELLEVLKEPKFQFLESEYQLASRLSMAEKDMKSAMELLKDAVSTLRTLKLGSREEQSNYLTTWSKIVSVCTEELKHGSYIWRQAVQGNVHNQILSNPKGIRYIRALGETYRVAEIIGASVKLYKPWMLLGPIDPTSLFSLLNECYSIWSGSGLEEAFFSISNQNSFEPDGVSRELVESIKYIHTLDEHSLQSYVISEKETTCQLSALPAGLIPGLKMVTWNGKHFLVMLANLWVNLVSSDPPKT